MRSSTLFLLTLLASATASALPSAPRAVCANNDAIGNIAACSGTVPACVLCHAGAPQLNAYGTAVADALYADAAYDFDNFDERLTGAIVSLNGTDTDGDGLTNLEELVLGTMPGNISSHYTAPAAPTGKANTSFNVGGRDALFAYRRVVSSFCGRSPTFDEVTAFKALADDSAKDGALHDALDTCVASDYWRNEALHRLADAKIRPLQSIGFDGLIPLADYAYDYRLFSHIMSGDRDVRDLLRATYHIDEDGNVVDGIIPRPEGSLLETGGQPLELEHRAGMITTQWFLMNHTMFSALPRTTAAQAYRAYLGLDIARGEGIHPVEGEPRDVDNRSVRAAECAVCHSTLDPLSYAFSYYNGIAGLNGGLEVTGLYDPNRVTWPEDSMMFGTPVTTLPEWARVASEQDAFFATVARTLWQGTFGQRPGPGDRLEFEALWHDLKQRADDGDVPRAEDLLHALIDTDAFRVP
jgi:hypothetical protein